MSSATWKSHTPVAVAKVKRAEAEAVRDVLDDLKARSQDRVPYQEGDLSNSAHVTVTTGAAGTEGAVAYDTPYAKVQHEDPTFRHQDGRTHNYLAGPLDENRARYQKYVVGKIRGALS